jgi:hypothetical protein
VGKKTRGSLPFLLVLQARDSDHKNGEKKPFKESMSDKI